MRKLHVSDWTWREAGDFFGTCYRLLAEMRLLGEGEVKRLKPIELLQVLATIEGLCETGAEAARWAAETAELEGQYESRRAAPPAESEVRPNPLARPTLRARIWEWAKTLLLAAAMVAALWFVISAAFILLP